MRQLYNEKNASFIPTRWSNINLGQINNIKTVI